MKASARARRCRWLAASASIPFVAAAACTSETVADDPASAGSGGEGGATVASSASAGPGGGMPGVVCGNGLIQPGEECDDGNDADADGCSAVCAVEVGYGCKGSPSECSSTCGDGVVASDEGCDDDGVEGEDGCSATCSVEGGWQCAGSPSVCGGVCGDDEVVGTEVCDGGDGCTETCEQAAGFFCEDGACAAVLWLGVGQSGDSGSLYRYDLDDQSATAVGSVAEPLTGLAFDADGTLWAISSRRVDTRKLWTVDTGTAALTEVAELVDGGEGGLADITFSGDTLFTFDNPGTGSVHAATIALDTGAISLLDGAEGASTFVPQGSGIAADADGDLYWVDNTTLYAVEVDTGAGTVVGELDCFSSRIPALTFRGGTLYAISEDLEIGVVDPTDASCTLEEGVVLPEGVDALASDWP